MYANKHNTRNAIVLSFLVLLTAASIPSEVSWAGFVPARLASGIQTQRTREVNRQGSQVWCTPADTTDQDAAILAMEISGALLPPTSLHDQLYNDLKAIRRSYPQMNSIRHRLRWVPGQLIVGLTQQAWEQFQSGDYHAWDDLNDRYGVIEITTLGSLSTVHLQFEEPYNPQYLAPLYAALDGVRYAEPNIFLGGGSEIIVSLPVYTFKMGWGDCQSGCIQNHYWEFIVTEGLVAFVCEYGDSVPPYAALMMNKQVDPQGVASGTPLTYTISVTNTGSVDLHATITDTLPTHIQPGATSGGMQILPGGTLTWTPTITAPGGIWAVQLTAATQIGYTGPLTNVARVSTDEGATGTCTLSVEAQAQTFYLPMVLRHHRSSTSKP